jgi:hypothetical protein
MLEAHFLFHALDMHGDFEKKIARRFARCADRDKRAADPLTIKIDREPMVPSPRAEEGTA